MAGNQNKHLPYGFLGVKRTRVLTDLSGSHNKVFLESEVESLDDYFAMMKAIFANPDFQARQEATVSEDHPYQSAKRNFLHH